MTIVIDYTPPPDFVRTSENDYRVGSGPINIICNVEGATGTISYLWSSTCSDCFAQGSTYRGVGLLYLRSDIGGTHTCTATDSDGGKTARECEHCDEHRW